MRRSFVIFYKNEVVMDIKKIKKLRTVLVCIFSLIVNQSVRAAAEAEALPEAEFTPVKLVLRENGGTGEDKLPKTLEAEFPAIPAIDQQRLNQRLTQNTIGRKGGLLVDMQDLLNKGADPNNVKPDGRAPLMHVVAGNVRDRLAKVRALIEAGADLNTLDLFEKGGTVLMTLVTCERKKADLDIIEELINAGADLNVQTRSKMTALMAAVTECDSRFVSKIVRLLILQGADEMLQDWDGNTALQLAHIREAREPKVAGLVDTIEQALAERKSAREACEEGRRMAQGYLLEGGPLAIDSLVGIFSEYVECDPVEKARQRATLGSERQQDRAAEMQAEARRRYWEAQAEAGAR
jgi:hypothetical protein